MEKFLNIVNKVLATKIGTFLFKFINLIALIFLTIYLFVHVQIVFGLLTLFCTVSTILLLIDRIKKYKKDKPE